MILSLFPGLGLLDAAFEAEGFQIVRGPDLLWGGDIRRFHVPAGVFSGVIGGPPCQAFSAARRIRGGARKEDLIPEFVRVVREAAPDWVVMENLQQAIGHPSVPAEWYHTKIRDYDCGGETKRTRAFWTWPFFVLAPSRAGGKPERAVMATTWKRSRNDQGFLDGSRPIEEYARLQGVPEIGRRLREVHASKRFAIHCLGNGVPMAMGRHIARCVRIAVFSKQQSTT